MNNFDYWSSRKSASIVTLLDFVALLTLLLWYGKDDEIGFLKNEFLEYSFEQCVPTCVSDVTLVAIARILLLIVIYVFGNLKNWIPVLIISLCISLATILEVAWIMLKLHFYSIHKFVFLGYTIVICWIEFGVILLTTSYEKYKKDKYYPPPPLYSISAIPNEINPTKVPELTENSPLLDSLSNSTLFRTSSIEKHRLGKYSDFYEEDNDIKQATGSIDDYSKLSRNVMPSIPRLVALMLDEKTGIELATRKYRFKSFANAFTGKDIVDWILVVLSNHTQTRAEAAFVAQQVMDAGYFEHVLKEKRFIDEASAIYQFCPNIRETLPVAPLDPPTSQRHFSVDEGDSSAPISALNIEYNYDNSETTKSIIDNPKLETKEEEIEKPVLSSTLSPELQQPEEETVSPEPMERKLSPLLKNFLDQMRKPGTGIAIKDRTYKISENESTTYYKCFPGSEAVDWLVYNRNLPERKHAMAIFQKLLQNRIIYSVNKSSKQFCDDDTLYRFKRDDPSNINN